MNETTLGQSVMIHFYCIYWTACYQLPQAPQSLLSLSHIWQHRTCPCMELAVSIFLLFCIPYSRNVREYTFKFLVKFHIRLEISQIHEKWSLHCSQSIFGFRNAKIHNSYRYSSNSSTKKRISKYIYCEKNIFF